MRTAKTAPSAHELQVDTHVHGLNLHFTTTWGLFHPKGVDAGTALLLDQLEVSADADCLDLGCGWGPIGVALAKLAPAGQVHMVDKDFVAVEYAQRNAVDNSCGNAQAYLSNGFSHVPADQTFDLVASNIPAKVGGELLQYWIETSQERLRPGGALWVVTVAGLKDYMKRVLRATFGNHKKIKQSGTHVVSMARKT